MGGPASIRPKRASATDLAYEALKKHGEAMHYKDLIQVILESNDVPRENVGRFMAQVHTEINLDSRFDHKGGGQWALREWSYRGGKVITVKTERPTARPVSKTRLLLEEEFGANDDIDDDVDVDSDSDDDTIDDGLQADDGDDGDDAVDTGDDWD